MMIRRMYLLRVLSILVAASLSMLSACGPAATPAAPVEAPPTAAAPQVQPTTGAKPPEQITLTFWKPSWGDADTTYLPPIFKAFEAAHPGVKIEFLFHPWDALMERYTTAFLGDNPPDVFYLPDLNYPKFAAAGFLTQLDQKFPDDVAKMKGDYYDQWWNAGVYNGHVYGVPYVHVGITLVYNKALFDAAGLPYPPGPDDPALADWTWAKFAEVTQKLTDPAKGQWGYAWAANWVGDSEVWMYCYQMQAGNWIAKPDFSGVGFDNPNGLKAFQYINDLVNTQKVIPDGGMNPKFQDLFLTGKAAIAPFDVYQAIGIIHDHPELNIGIAPYPQGPGTDLLDGRGMHANVGFLYLASKSKHPEMAWELMKFMNEKAQVEDYVNTVGLFGARKDYEMKLADPKAQDIARQVLSASTKFGFANQINPKMIEIRALYVAEIQNMLQKIKTPEQAWKDAVTSMNAILSQP